MKMKTAYTLLMALALSATAARADEDAAKLRADLDALTERLAVLEESGVAADTSSWTDKITVKGDLRYRLEYVEKDDATSKNRQRIRARLGAYADVNDFTSAGIRIRTGQAANSGNQSIGSDFNAKDIYLDLAYITLSPEDAKYGAVTLGKMKFPWEVITDLIWDSDVNPEGVAYIYEGKADNTAIFGSAGYFKVQESSSTHDLNLGTGQLGVSQPIGEKTKATLGGSLYVYDNAKDFTDPSTSTNYMVNYTIGELFAEVAVKEVLPVPFKFYGNYINNLEESSDNTGFCVGIKFGDSKKGKWEAKVDYRDLDMNAAPAAYTDSDFAGGGTDVKGGRIKAAYNVGKNLQLATALICGREKSSDTDVNTVQLDFIAKF
ncbi:putative porin [Pontiella sp.]|uniref:putative porin n=1 Tax=Pontiella sp. TaxID=2837462 RepID=UPI003569AA64